MKDGVMLNARSNNMIAFVDQARDRQVVGLGAAAGENDLRRLTAEQCGHTISRVLDRGTTVLPILVNGRGVAELLAEIGTHCVQNFRQDGRCSVIVEVNAAHEKPGFYSTLGGRREPCNNAREPHFPSSGGLRPAWTGGAPVATRSC